MEYATWAGDGIHIVLRQEPQKLVKKQHAGAYMAKRPLSVTIIAWFLIITSIFSALSFWSTFNSPLAEQVMAQSALPRSAQMAFSALSLILNLVFGVAFLKRQNWARYAYVGINLLGMAIGFFTSPFTSMILLSGIFLAVIAFFLFRKPADDWFRGTPT